MSKTKCWLILIFVSELSKFGDDVNELFANKFERLSHNDDICIVTDIAAGRTKMDNALGLGALLSIGVYMAHYVMSYFLLSCSGNIIIDVILMALKLIDLLLSNIKSQFLLNLRKGDPESSPGSELHVLGKNVLHLLTCVTFR